MKHVSHQQVSQLLHNKFIVVLGDSIQRAVYKDLVLLLQKEKYLTTKQLKTKGEMSFEQDCLVEGGCLSQMHNGSDYKEVRQFQSAHHLVRFYFVTRIYSRYMQSILDDFQHGLKPDVVIVNSCVWDISRYSSRWINDYKENLDRFFDELRNMLPEETLVIWNLTMPLGERIKGGFLVPEIEHKASHLRFDVVEANFYSGTLADAYGMDVLDLHFQFRFSLQHRTKDGVHWNALTHRRITSLLLQHTAQAWGVIWPSALTSVGEEDYTHTHTHKEACSATISWNLLWFRHPGDKRKVINKEGRRIFISLTFLSSSAGRGSGGHWPHSAPHPVEDKYSHTSYVSCSSLLFFNWKTNSLFFFQGVTLIFRDFLSSLMTVSLSSSLTPRPSASVISALTVDALTSTGEV
uniref:Family with sequence similarity 113 n=1 Tax=Stegastes partitus TaxID=144197 RepID=A0A3B5B719_9TELE